jgi:superfamily II DNA/RNA helicase
MSTTALSFKDLNLSQPILSALTRCGYTEPTPIQQRAIPVAMLGKDIIATAQTGTGKTAAFVLPALERLLATPKRGKPRVLVLTPTRELANQVNEAAGNYGDRRFKIVSILGGMSFGGQLRDLKRPVDILVATPGRLLDHMERGSVDLSCIEMLILDEADRMLDMGFIDDVETIVKATPKNRQTLLFTATLGHRLVKLAGNILRTPERIEVAGKKVTLESIEQRIYLVDDESHKNRVLQHLINNEDMSKLIIFSATKRNADKLARQLYTLGHAAGALHGDMKQHKRNQTIKQFHGGDLRLLVATDVAARGIDVRDVSHVINYDLPKFAEDYVHRIGRTGRAGKSGIAISLILSSDVAPLKRIERFTGQQISSSTIVGLEPRKVVHRDKPMQKPGFRKPFKKRYNNQRSYAEGGRR